MYVHSHVLYPTPILLYGKKLMMPISFIHLDIIE